MKAMGMRLLPCPSCSRHVRAGDTACPFCSSELPATPADTRPILSRPRTRAAILFAGAAVVGACSSTAATPAYGIPATDSGLEDSGDNGNPEGGPVALYGPAPVDSGLDTGSDVENDAEAGDGGDEAG